MLINNWISKVVQLITTTDLQGCGTLRKISTEQVWRVSRESRTKVMFKKKIIISFKIFPRFWLAKSTRLIHYNQLLMTKFGRILCLARKWRQKCRLSCFGCELEKWRTFHSFQEFELGEKIAKNMERTARRQLEGRHLLFGEYFRSWTTLETCTIEVSMF